MQIWVKLLVVVALALLVTGWGWLLDLSVTGAHTWLVEQIGHTGMRLVIGAMVLTGAWALWNEREG